MAKVLFVNPVIREEDDPRHVPYGIALLAAIVVREGHRVQVYDANAWRASDAVLAQVLKADRWDVVAVGGITTAYRSIKHIVAMARALAPQALIVAGGGFVTSMPHDIMRLMPEVDVSGVGEACVSFVEELRLLVDLPVLLPPRDRRRHGAGRARWRARRDLHVQARDPLPQPTLRRQPGEVRPRAVRRRLHRLPR